MSGQVAYFDLWSMEGNKESGTDDFDTLNYKILAKYLYVNSKEK